MTVIFLRKILTVRMSCARIRRIEWLFETFSSVCLSFLVVRIHCALHLVAEVAAGETPFLCTVH
ncbi:putative phosphoadenosine phosphosulfate reductase family protein [Klebsiella pneumoniae]|uniref:Putative phosphoadenosine phosphosulfate reductase family protein n=1 Tax=Klebsiella pneumoniae TaxID=573 RepID=A0A2X3CC93_KLEPN|nr:putative phosphoadenosine phosphosulfate reductase family protein [Klebsiella pneumoniae]